MNFLKLNINLRDINQPECCNGIYAQLPGSFGLSSWQGTIDTVSKFWNTCKSSLPTGVSMADSEKAFSSKTIGEKGSTEVREFGHIVYQYSNNERLGLYARTMHPCIILKNRYLEFQLHRIAFKNCSYSRYSRYFQKLLRYFEQWKIRGSVNRLGARLESSQNSQH